MRSFSVPAPTRFFTRKRILLGSMAALVFLAAFIPAGIMQNGLDAPVAVGPFINGKFPATTPGQSSGGWTIEDAYPNLTFNSPIHMVEEPGTDRLLIASWGGSIESFDKNDTATYTKNTWLDISNQVIISGEHGLLSFALHPRFGIDSNYVYVFYQYPDPGSSRVYTRISRFTAVPGGVADPASELVLIQQLDRAINHNGGALFFGNDHYLYVSIGDEGGADNPFGNCQDINYRLFGGILRIDVDRNPATSHPILRQPALLDGNDYTVTANYFIPNDNPFNNPNGSVLEEFYAIGLRNPHRVSYDAPTSRIWAGDVGQDQREEVDLIVAGGNYQWGYKEGTIGGPQSQPTPLVGTGQGPVHEYDHNIGNCIIGGYVYRGPTHADLTGKYIFADNGSKRVWAMDYTPGQAPVVSDLLDLPFGSSYYSISAFSTDLDGELYILKFNGAGTGGGKIYKLARQNPGSPEPPALLSQTGAFKNLATLEPEDYLVPYGMNVPFWSDGALKKRWIVLPNDGSHDQANEKITYSETGNWAFPEGTVFVKHFEMPIDEANPAVTRRIETRFFVHGTDGAYYGVTYRWRDDQSDAELLNTSRSDTLSVSTANGPREIAWYYPSRSECLTCHNEPAGSVLGIKTRQLNGNLTYPRTGRNANQLTTFAHLGMFDVAPDTNNLSALLTSVHGSNTSASLEKRARSYLDINCSSCHRPGTGVQANFDARMSTPLEATGIIYGQALKNLGIHDGRLILPQSPDVSVLYRRINKVHEANAMPPISKNLLDTVGVQLIRDWISQMDPAFTTGCSEVNFNDYSITTYGGTQDAGTFVIEDGGATLRVENNGWKKVALPYTITPNTVLEFDFKSTLQGEEHAIGFDTDDASDGNRFQLYGTQTTAAIQAYRTYNGSGGWQHFVIPVGNYLSGTFSHLVFLADKDAAPTNTNSYFSHLKLYETDCNSVTNQRITFSAPTILRPNDPPLSLNATSSSGLPVTFSLDYGPVSLNGGLLSVNGATGFARVIASQSGNSTFEAAPEEARTFLVAPVGKAIGGGLKATYFDDANLSLPAITRTDPQIDFYWGSGSPAADIQYNTFSARWEGEIEPPVSGTYTFYVTADDGVRLWINNQLVVNNWTDGAAGELSGTIQLTAWQRVPIKMEYYESRVYSSVRLEWSSGDIVREVVPSHLLYPPAVLPVDPEEEGFRFSAYPNPAQEQLFVEWEARSARSITLSLSDISGREVYRQRFGSQVAGKTPLSLQGLQAGVYLLRIEENGRTHTRKVLVK